MFKTWDLQHLALGSEQAPSLQCQKLVLQPLDTCELGHWHFTWASSAVPKFGWKDPQFLVLFCSSAPLLTIPCDFICFLAAKWAEGLKHRVPESYSQSPLGYPLTSVAVWSLILEARIVSALNVINSASSQPMIKATSMWVKMGIGPLLDITEEKGFIVDMRERTARDIWKGPDCAWTAE